MVLVDTSIWIEAARREGDLQIKIALEHLLDEDEAGLCSIVLLEFLGGARPQDRKKLAYWLGNLPSQAVEESHWSLATDYAWKLRDAGCSLPWSDILIGAVANSIDARVYAKDQHFDMMQSTVGLRLYQPGYAGGYQPD